MFLARNVTGWSIDRHSHSCSIEIPSLDMITDPVLWKMKTGYRAEQIVEKTFFWKKT